MCSPGLTTANNRVSTFTVFNTNSWPRTDLVILPKELHLPGDCVEDAAGNVVRSQRLASGEFAFLATDVPPLAGKPYTIKAGKHSTTSRLKVHGSTLAGADLTVSIDPQDRRHYQPAQPAVGRRVGRQEGGHGAERLLLLAWFRAQKCAAERPGHDLGERARAAAGIAADRQRCPGLQSP